MRRPDFSTSDEVPGCIRHLGDRMAVVSASDPDLLPDFEDLQNISCFSDYSGEGGDQRIGDTVIKNHFFAYAYLMMDWNFCGEWVALLRDLREGDLGDARMEFKKIRESGDSRKTRNLKKYLEISEKLNGLLLLILVDKSIRYMFTEGSPSRELEPVDLGHLKPQIAEKLLRVLHFQALFASALTSSNNGYFWMTDRDAISQNSEALGKTMQGIFNLYLKHKLNPFGYSTEPFQGCLHETEDLLCLTDLAAGATLEYYNQLVNLGDRIVVQNKTREILQWLTLTQGSLKKIVWIIEAGEVEGQKAHVYRMHQLEKQ